MGELVVRFKRSGKAVVYNPKHKEIADCIELDKEKAKKLIETGKAKLYMESGDRVAYRTISLAINNSEAILGGTAEIEFYVRGADDMAVRIYLENTERINLLLNKSILYLIEHIKDSSRKAEISLKCDKNGELDLYSLSANNGYNLSVVDREEDANVENALDRICKLIEDGYTIKKYNGKDTYIQKDIQVFEAYKNDKHRRSIP